MQRITAAADPTASHNCFAYRVAGAYRSSDDGEPSGTAGRPILGAIESDGLDGVCVLVTRHFGGIKLGSGGLVRAYAGAARDCLRAAPKAFVHRQVQVKLCAPFEWLGAMYNLLQKHGATTVAEDYESNGGVTMTVLVRESAVGALKEAVANVTSGKVAASVLE